MNWISDFFQLQKRNTTFKQEIFGGIATFLTMSYIVFVNPSILAETGMDKGALITVTCITTAFGTILIALLANVPVALAPGMGLNVFFTFGLVLGQGIPWQDALGVVFLSGIFFCILSLSGIRKKIAEAIPYTLIVSSTAGIGLFITLIGLKNMGLIVANEVTLVALGKFTPQLMIALLALLIMVVFEIKKIRGGILAGIIVATIIAITLGYSSLPKGVISLPPSIEPIAFKLNIWGALKWSLIGSIFSFMFIDMFDSLAFLLACLKKIDLPAEEQEKSLGRMLYADVTATLVGATLGTSTVTSFGESATGIAAGARTGLASLVTGGLFLVTLLFSPLVEIVPPFASAPALVIVGIFMFQVISTLDLNDMKTAAPAFITMILMPLTYSISVGLSFGFISYIIIHAILKEWKSISPALWVIGALSVINILLL